jgi:hypothetical protein
MLITSNMANRNNLNIIFMEQELINSRRRCIALLLLLIVGAYACRKEYRYEKNDITYVDTGQVRNYKYFGQTVLTKTDIVTGEKLGDSSYLDTLSVTFDFRSGKVHVWGNPFTTILKDSTDPYSNRYTFKADSLIATFINGTSGNLNYRFSGRR